MMKRNHSDSPELNDIQDNDLAVVAGGATVNKRAKVDPGDWEALFQRLGNYKEQHGHCSVPLQNEDDPELGIWVAQQRELHTAEGGNKLTEDQLTKLNSIGFEWQPRNPRHMQWETRFSQLQRFKQKYGHAQVPIGWPENVQLANWVSKQRQEYKNLLRGRTTRLDENRIRLLNGVGFAWQLQRGGRRRQIKARTSTNANHSGPGSDGESTGSDKDLPGDNDGPCILPGEVLIGQGASTPMSPNPNSSVAPDRGQAKKGGEMTTKRDVSHLTTTADIMTQGPAPSPLSQPLRNSLLLQRAFGQQKLSNLIPSSSTSSSMYINSNTMGMPFLSATGANQAPPTTGAPSNDLLEFMLARNSLLQSLHLPQAPSRSSLHLFGANGGGGGNTSSAFSRMAAGLQGSSETTAAANSASSQTAQSQFLAAAAAQRSVLLPMLRQQPGLFFPLGAFGNSSFSLAQAQGDAVGMGNLLADAHQRQGVAEGAGLLGVRSTGANGGSSSSASDESVLPMGSRASEERTQQLQQQYLYGARGLQPPGASLSSNAGDGHAPSSAGGTYGFGLQGGSTR